MIIHSSISIYGQKREGEDVNEEFLHARRKALEGLFFHQLDQELIRQLREKKEVRQKREALSAASGITSDAVLDKLISLDVSSETLAALSLVPVVTVAWADRKMDERERDAVLKGAEKAGLSKGDISYQLLEGWLVQRPDSELIATWKEYIGALLPTLDEEARDALRKDLLERAREVAEATGGFLGFSEKISTQEEAVLEEIDHAFL